MKGNRGTQKNLLYLVLIAHTLTLKINMDGGCSHEIKRCLLLVRIAMTNLDNVLKNKDITFPTKVCVVKAMVFSSSHVWVLELDQ